MRPSSISFLDRNGELSVHRASETAPERVLTAYPGHSLVAFSVSAVRELGYQVTADPTPEDPSHAIITPEIKKKHRKKLVDACEWVVLR